MKIYAINLFEFLYMFSVIKPQDYHKLKKDLKIIFCKSDKFYLLLFIDLIYNNLKKMYKEEEKTSLL